MESNMGAADIMRKSGQRLLTADRIGISLVALGVLADQFGFDSVQLVGLGVFGPSLLRELGLLRDGDEFTRHAVYRACFHALLLNVLLLVVFMRAFFIGGFPSGSSDWNLLLANMSFLYHVSLTVFAISYVVQYWGVQLGISRVLSGLSVIAGLSIFRDAIHHFIFSLDLPAWGAWSEISLIACMVFLVLAQVVSRRPRVGGILLLGVLFLALVGVGFGIVSLQTIPDTDGKRVMVQLLTTTFVFSTAVFGSMGVALLRNQECS